MGIRYHYPAESGNGRVVDYLQDRLSAIRLCFDEGQPEACLTLIYSGIDTLGFLGAPGGVTQATRKTFIPWSEAYLVGRVKAVDGGAVTAMDLYSARCGILHTSTPESDYGNTGKAHEVFYRYRGHQGFRIFLNVPLPPISVDLEHLCLAFREGANLFIEHVNADFDLAQLAYSRAEGFMRWGIPATPLAPGPVKGAEG